MSNFKNYYSGIFVALILIAKRRENSEKIRLIFGHHALIYIVIYISIFLLIQIIIYMSIFFI